MRFDHLRLDTRPGRRMLQGMSTEDWARLADAEISHDVDAARVEVEHAITAHVLEDHR